MNFASFKNTLMLLLVATLLSACGGGGGSDSDGGFTPPGISLNASSSSVAINTRSATAISIQLNQSSGGAVPNGTSISGTVNGVGLGNLAAVGTGTNGLTATGVTTGGVANFIFQSGGAPASGTITFSAQDPNVPGRTASVTVNVTVSAGPGSDPRITFQPEKLQIPVNSQGVGFFLGSPFISEVLVNIRSASGQPINTTPSGDQAVQYSIDPVELGAVSVLDNPETTDVNELTTPWGGIFGGVASGTSRAFVWSDTQPGTLNLRAAFTDPDTGQRAEAVLAFQIVSTIPPLPASIVILAPETPIYARNSGGTATGSMSVVVLDGNGAPVANPVSGNNAFNNVRLELLYAGGEGDATLAASNAAGQSQDAQSIVVRTTDGSASALIRSGVRIGTYTLRATTDRADNNVDNGITDPIVAERTLVISDGRLFNIELTQPSQNALVVNPVDPTAGPTPGQVPNSPDGTYSVTVAVIATDRLGNPVIPGTAIKFGLIDEPQVTGAGDFQIAGNDGNPQEGGTLFTAVTGQFRTAGGGAGPGDALAIFGKDVDGNRDLEGARVVASVNSQTSLTVQRRFNRNDDTGVSVDYLGVLPYVIGRAQEGNIVAEGVTNEFGVARTTMTYPVSRLGKRVIVWGQGEGDIINGQPETVSDVDVLAFAGVGPIELTASPAQIPANTTAAVQVCALDALDTPLQGVVIGFSFGALQGNGSVDGTADAGVLDNTTGADGCVIATVVTSGVSVTGGTVVFSAGGDTASVAIVRDALVLQAQPTLITDPSTIVTLTLRNGTGDPQPGFLITGTCTGTNGTQVTLSEGPGITNAAGQTTVRVNASNLDQVNVVGGGTCTFRTVDGSATATVTIQGRDICTLEFSPPPAGCGPPPAAFTLTINLTSDEAYTVRSDPTGLNCTVAAGNAAGTTCTADFEEGTTVSLFTAPSVSVTWLGECAPAGGNPSIGASVEMDGDRICNISSIGPPP